MKEIKLGDRVKDEVSGLSGIAVGVTVFLHGCRRVTILPQAKKGSVEHPDSFTVDMPQCKVIKRGVVKTSSPLDDEDDDGYSGGDTPYEVTKSSY